MKTVTFGSLAVGDKFILHVLGSEILFTKTGITIAESGSCAVGLDDDCLVFPAI